MKTTCCPTLMGWLTWWNTKFSSVCSFLRWEDGLLLVIHYPNVGIPMHFFVFAIRLLCGNGMYSYIHWCLHCLPFGHLYIYLLFLLLIISLERFRRGSTNRCIHCVNWMIYWTTWNNSLPYMTQVIKAFTWNFSSFFITN